MPIPLIPASAMGSLRYGCCPKHWWWRLPRMPRPWSPTLWMKQLLAWRMPGNACCSLRRSLRSSRSQQNALLRWSGSWQCWGIISRTRCHWQMCIGALTTNTMEPAAQANMQEKISTLPGMDVKRVVEIKLAELRAATPWLKDLGYGTDGIPGIAFTGAWVCLSETVAHFEHRLRHM